MAEDLKKYMDCLIQLEDGPRAISDQEIVSWLTAGHSRPYARLVPGTVEHCEIIDAGRNWLAHSPCRKT
jgi:hypothetical protein